MSNLASLKPFVKGDDPRRNITGENKGSFSLLNLLKAEIQKCPEGQDKKTYADLIIKRMLKESIEKGDIQHIKTIWAYVEGMPKESHDITSGGEKIIPIYGGNSISFSRHPGDPKDILPDQENQSN